ncbi:hypothetical protein LQ384_18320 [Rhodococcus rhodochrous]|uniref:Acyl-CoA dehydrogenase/oxidase C-terminal domain-containing protein n=1 Tax=Rhodococcus rhodochrous TaxID=1829 RepID=A0AAW4XK06_RHORH|nr:acyl-CoA dehydrogenase family protein [Rhodococcus rhodochrous]MCD2113070.1 hypothetical protein [Rhodococcus rhodochrous]
MSDSCRTVTSEAMEIRGGSGYIEDRVFARLVRDSHLGSLWEGSSNVIALDVLRSMRKSGAHRVLADAQRTLLDVAHPECAPVVAALRERWDVLEARGEDLLAGDDTHAQTRCAAYTDDLARTVMAPPCSWTWRRTASNTVSATGRCSSPTPT